jgi:hypothetical protein
MTSHEITYEKKKKMLFDHILNEEPLKDTEILEAITNWDRRLGVQYILNRKKEGFLVNNEMESSIIQNSAQIDSSSELKQNIKENPLNIPIELNRARANKLQQKSCNIQSSAKELVQNAVKCLGSSSNKEIKELEAKKKYFSYETYKTVLISETAIEEFKRTIKSSAAIVISGVNRSGQSTLELSGENLWNKDNALSTIYVLSVDNHGEKNKLAYVIQIEDSHLFFDCFEFLFSNSLEIAKICYNWKIFTAQLLSHKWMQRKFYEIQFPIQNVFDPKLAAWILNPDCIKEDIEFSALTSRIGRRNFLAQNRDMYTKLGLTSDIHDMLWSKICENKQDISYLEQEMPLSQLLGEMQCTGVGFDPDKLKAQRSELDSEIFKTEQEIWKFAGAKFSVSSSDQVSNILFEKLKLPYPSNSGNPNRTNFSTSVNISLHIRHLMPHNRRIFLKSYKI